MSVTEQTHPANLEVSLREKGCHRLAAFALCGLSFGLIFFYGDTDVSKFGFFDLTVLGFGAFRLIHLITIDQVLDFARAAVMGSNGEQLKLWSALIIVTVYLFGPWGRLAILVLAVAGLRSLLQLASKAIAGWRSV